MHPAVAPERQGKGRDRDLKPGLDVESRVGLIAERTARGAQAAAHEEAQLRLRGMRNREEEERRKKKEASHLGFGVRRWTLCLPMKGPHGSTRPTQKTQFIPMMSAL